ncbi:MAG TPA: hypothetical protein VJP85_12800, partial [Candidatus Baltobacteraceae bacterium]|nr:hypothetical protein [Candidatus Baltobacteraceae bacterium]
MHSVLPGRSDIIAKLGRPMPERPYVADQVVVVYRAGTMSPDAVSVNTATMTAIRTAAARHTLRQVATPQYTNDAALNQQLARLG